MTSKRISALTSSGWLGEPEFGRIDDAALAAFGHRFEPGLDGVARLDLDKEQRAAAAGDDVDLAERRFPAPRHDPVGLGDQQHGGAAFGREAKPERLDALRARRWLEWFERGAPNRSRLLIAFFGERQRALIDLAPRQAGGIGDFTDGIFERNAAERLAQQRLRFRPHWRVAAPPAAR